MAKNCVQFQSGLSMVAFMQHYGTEAKCYRALYRAYWVNVLLATSNVQSVEATTPSAKASTRGAI